jgi:hypothetical protein
MWSRKAAALGKMHQHPVNSLNNAHPYAYGSHANKTSNGRLCLKIVEAKWPELNEYTAQLKQATQKASPGNSELYMGWMDVLASDGNLPNWMG